MSCPTISSSTAILAARRSIERLAIEGYRAGKLTHHQASQLLGLTRFELDQFLVERKIYDHAYSIEDLEQDLTDLEKLRAQDLPR